MGGARSRRGWGRPSARGHRRQGGAAGSCTPVDPCVRSDETDTRDCRRALGSPRQRPQRVSLIGRARCPSSRSAVPSARGSSRSAAAATADTSTATTSADAMATAVPAAPPTLATAAPPRDASTPATANAPVAGAGATSRIKVPPPPRRPAPCLRRRPPRSRRPRSPLRRRHPVTRAPSPHPWRVRRSPAAADAARSAPPGCTITVRRARTRASAAVHVMDDPHRRRASAR